MNRQKPRKTAGRSRIPHSRFAFLLLLATCITGTAVFPDPVRAAGRKLPPREIVLYDFSDNHDLDRLHWQCGTVYQRTADHAGSGKWSLKVEMYPAGEEWPGFGTGFPDGIPDGYCLELGLSNPAPTPLTMYYRIDDRSDPPYGDRLNGQVLLRPGRSRLVFDFSRLATPKTRRRLDPEKIRRFLLFLPRPSRKTVIYIDSVILTRTPAAGPEVIRPDQ